MRSRHFIGQLKCAQHLAHAHYRDDLKIGGESPTASQQTALYSMIMSNLHLTTVVGQANIVFEWVESWISSHIATEHMVKIMKGATSSTRHELFMIKRERNQCSGSEISRLHQLSNPCFLDGDGEKDLRVIKYLIDHVFVTAQQQPQPQQQNNHNCSWVETK